MVAIRPSAFSPGSVVDLPTASVEVVESVEVASGLWRRALANGRWRKRKPSSDQTLRVPAL